MVVETIFFRIPVTNVYQHWFLICHLRFLNAELNIEFLRKPRIIYAIHDVINFQNVGSWICEKVFPYGNIDAESFQNVRKYEIFILL